MELQELKALPVQGQWELPAPRQEVQEQKAHQQGTQQQQGSTTQSWRTQTQRKQGLKMLQALGLQAPLLGIREPEDGATQDPAHFVENLQVWRLMVEQEQMG